MDFIGFDLGKVSSQVCIIIEGGELVERRIRTDCEQIGKLLGGISKAGSGRARSMLVEASWLILRGRNPTTEALYQWAARIAARRGKKVAAVAPARKLAGILYAMWRDGTNFAAQSPHALSAAA